MSHENFVLYVRGGGSGLSGTPSVVSGPKKVLSLGIFPGFSESCLQYDVARIKMPFLLLFWYA